MRCSARYALNIDMSQDSFWQSAFVPGVSATLSGNFFRKLHIAKPRRASASFLLSTSHGYQRKILSVCRILFSAIFNRSFSCGHLSQLFRVYPAVFLWRTWILVRNFRDVAWLVCEIVRVDFFVDFRSPGSQCLCLQREFLKNSGTRLQISFGKKQNFKLRQSQLTSRLRLPIVWSVEQDSPAHAPIRG
jgi:hypothetical protein